MKKKIGILLTLLTLSMIAMPVSAWEFDVNQIFTTGSRNAVLNEMTYNGTSEELYFYVSARNDSWFNIGLASFEACFNRSWIPENLESITAYLILDNGTTYEAQDQIKNYTYMEDVVLVNWNSTDDGHELVRDCAYFQTYVYLFENQSVTNEQSMADYLMWGNTVFQEDDIPTERPALSTTDQSFIIAAETSSSSGNDIRINFGGSDGSWLPAILLISGAVGLVVAAIIIMILYSKKQR